MKLHNPLENPQGETPSYVVPESGKFTAAKGKNTNIVEHHPAVDIYFTNKTTQVNLYALFDGEVRSIKDADKYRDYLVLSKDIENENNDFIGKIVAVYAHIDLTKDESSGLYLNNTSVKKGDEEFYGICNTSNTSQYTEKSVEPWQYGCWNPDIAYGYADPRNYGLVFY